MTEMEAKQRLLREGIEEGVIQETLTMLKENRNLKVVLQAAQTLDEYQMEQLRLAWEDGRTDEQVKWLASTGLNADQMKQLRGAWEEGRTDEQVKWLASTDLSWQQMKQQRLAWKAEEAAPTPVAPVQPTNGTMQPMNSFGSMQPHTPANEDPRPYMEKGAIGDRLQVESPMKNTINDTTTMHDREVSSTGLLKIVMQAIHIYLVVTLFIFIIFYTTLPTKVFSLLLATAAAFNFISGYLTTKFEAEAPHGKLFELSSAKYFICAYVIMLATQLAIIPVLIVLAGELFVLGVRHVEVEGQPLLHVNQFFEGAVASVLCIALLLLLNGVSTLVLNGIVLIVGALNAVYIIRKVASNYANFKKAFVHD